MYRFELFVIILVFFLVVGFIGCTQGFNNEMVEQAVLSKMAQKEKETPEAEVTVVMDQEEAEQKQPGKLEEGAFRPHLRVHFIDIGQGDATLIQTPNKANFLIDCGNKNNYMTLKNYLKEQGIKKINALIVTHPDSEHYGGCEEALDNDFVVQAVYDNGKVEDGELFREFQNFARKTYYQHVPHDYTIVIDPAIRTEFITAYGPGYAVENKDDNSLIFKITYGSSSFLFMGDCEEKCEENIYRKERVGSIDILKVGSHGEKTATNKFFLERIKPEIAVISVGGRNRYNFPDQEVLNRLNDIDAEVYRTDLNGNIIITTDGNSIRTITERQ